MASKKPRIQRTNDEIRELMLKYFYDKNFSAQTIKSKKRGAAATINALKSGLKAIHGFQGNEVVGNLRYLISEGWVEEKEEETSYTNPKTNITYKSKKEYYMISSAGIDEVEGPSRFTRDKFSGIKIDAKGQNIITLGDGNRINAKFKDAGESLNALKDAIKNSSALSQEKKVDLVMDIESIQDQLAKPTPNRTVISTLWQGIAAVASIDGVVDFVDRAYQLLIPLISN